MTTFPLISHEVVGRLLFAWECIILCLWIIYAHQSVSAHDESASTESVLAASHFVVALTITALYNDLSHAVHHNVFRPVHVSYTWLVPPVIACVFDAFSVQRAYVFHKENNF